MNGPNREGDVRNCQVWSQGRWHQVLPRPMIDGDIYPTAPHLYWSRWARTAKPIPNDFDALWRQAHFFPTATHQVDELQRKLKGYEPVNTFDDLNIEQWRERALTAESDAERRIKMVWEHEGTIKVNNDYIDLLLQRLRKARSTIQRIAALAGLVVVADESSRPIMSCIVCEGQKCKGECLDPALNWTLDKARELCIRLEAVVVDCGAHIALTGGVLYKDGPRKDCDIVVYRHGGREEPIDRKCLMRRLKKLRLRPVRTEGRVWKMLYEGRQVDFLIHDAPEAADPAPTYGDESQP
jgi:hypothetical protein